MSSYCDRSWWQIIQPLAKNAFRYRLSCIWTSHLWMLLLNIKWNRFHLAFTSAYIFYSNVNNTGEGNTDIWAQVRFNGHHYARFKQALLVQKICTVLFEISFLVCKYKLPLRQTKQTVQHQSLLSNLKFNNLLINKPHEVGTDWVFQD